MTYKDNQVVTACIYWFLLHSRDVIFSAFWWKKKKYLHLWVSARAGGQQEMENIGKNPTCSDRASITRCRDETQIQNVNRNYEGVLLSLSFMTEEEEFDIS